MRIKAWGDTDVGLKRKVNQDSILIDPDLGLYIVADGMGGHKGGEVASAIAIETTQAVLEKSKQNDVLPRDAITHAYVESSSNIYNHSCENEELAGMGTTMVMSYFEESRFFIGNVGDSRAYLFHDNMLWQMTDDHSLVNEQLRAGVIKEQDMDKITGKNVITRSVGFEKEVNSDIFERKIDKGDVIILCSDGLTGMVNDQELLLLCRNFKGKEFVHKSIEAAKKAGGDDNISVIYIEVG